MLTPSMRVLFCVVARPVDRELQRPRRVGGDRVRVGGRREAGQHPVHLLIVPAQRHGQVLQFRRDQARVHLGRVGLQLRRLGIDGDRVAHRADFERHVDARDAVDADGHFGLLERLEALLADLQTVDAGRQIAES